MSAYDPLDSEADAFRPPAISTVVGCLHCREVYDSYRIEWRIETDHTGRPDGFWCCPIENCDGRGFGFDIFPVDPEYRDENGEKMWTDDAEESDDFSDEDDIPDENEKTDSHEHGSNGSNGVKPKDDESLPW